MAGTEVTHSALTVWCVFCLNNWTGVANTRKESIERTYMKCDTGARQLMRQANCTIITNAVVVEVVVEVGVEEVVVGVVVVIA